jgi:nicotinamidase-related amidase
MGRTWDRFLTDDDRAHVALHPAKRKGAGRRPVLLLVDLHRAAFGDQPLPLLEAVERWPASCGLAGWQALPAIQRLLAAARSAGIPVIHATGMSDFASWREGEPRGGTADRTHDPEAAERHRQRYDIIDDVAPIDGEVVIRKAAPSAFWGTPLVAHLNQVGADTIVIAGESTSGCVRATVVDGKSNRLRMVVVEDCVFDRHEASHAINLFDIDQKYGDVVPLAEALAYLDSHARWRTANGS